MNYEYTFLRLAEQHKTQARRIQGKVVFVDGVFSKIEDVGPTFVVCTLKSKKVRIPYFSHTNNVLCSNERESQIATIIHQSCPIAIDFLGHTHEFSLHRKDAPLERICSSFDKIPLSRLVNEIHRTFPISTETTDVITLPLGTVLISGSYSCRHLAGLTYLLLLYRGLHPIAMYSGLPDPHAHILVTYRNTNYIFDSALNLFGTKDRIIAQLLEDKKPVKYHTTCKAMRTVPLYH